MNEPFLLLVEQPPFAARFRWGFVKAAVLVRHGAESGERGTLAADGRRPNWEKEVGLASEAG